MRAKLTRSKILSVLVMILILLTPTSGWAKKGNQSRAAKVSAYAPGASSIVVHAGTGAILHSDNPHAPRYPASLTKMMTLYLLFEALEQRKITIKQHLRVSVHASRQSPSKLYLKPGDTISVNDAILALVTKSANDVAVVVGEGLSGSEAAFADRMTSKAQELGMRNTVFKNANGWHNKGQRTTAHDMAILLKSIIKKYPRYYKYFGTKTFTFRGQKHGNHNKLLGKYNGMDGGKTGFTCPSGFNLAASAVQSGHRLIAVVMGGTTGHARDKHMAGLLDKSFMRVKNKNQAAQAPDTDNEDDDPVLAPEEPLEEAVEVPRNQPKRMVRHMVPAPSVKPAVLLKTSTAAQKKTRKVITNSQAEWGVQVGAYTQLRAAQKRAKEVVARFDKMGTANIQVSPLITKSKKGRKIKKVYRARIENLPQSQAHKVCSLLKSKKEECLVFHK